MTRFRKDPGLAEQGEEAGEEDEDESDREETAKKSFFRENTADAGSQGLCHAKAGRDKGGEEGDLEQSTVFSKMIESSEVAVNCKINYLKF